MAEGTYRRGRLWEFLAERVVQSLGEGTDVVGDAFGNLLLSVLFKSVAEGTDIVGDAFGNLLLSVLFKVWLKEQISSGTPLEICC